MARLHLPGMALPDALYLYACILAFWPAVTPTTAMSFSGPTVDLLIEHDSISQSEADLAPEKFAELLPTFHQQRAGYLMMRQRTEPIFFDGELAKRSRVKVEYRFHDMTVLMMQAAITSIFFPDARYDLAPSEAPGQVASLVIWMPKPSKNDPVSALLQETLEFIGDTKMCAAIVQGLRQVYGTRGGAAPEAEWYELATGLWRDARGMVIGPGTMDGREDAMAHGVAWYRHSTRQFLSENNEEISRPTPREGPAFQPVRQRRMIN